MESAFWANISKKKSEEQKSLSDILKSIPIFSTLNRRELKKVEQIVHLRNYRAQEVVFRQSEPGVGMYVVRSGEVDIVYDLGSHWRISRWGISSGRWLFLTKRPDRPPPWLWSRRS